MIITKRIVFERRQPLGFYATASDERTFWESADKLKAANKVLLNFVLKHPVVTDIPGFDVWFDLFKTALAQLPQRWFVSW